MKKTLLALVALLPACASSGLTSSSAPVRSQVETSDGLTSTTYEFSVTSDDRVAETVVAGAPDAHWPRLAAAYEKLGLQLVHVDGGRRMLQGQAVARSGRVAGTRVSQLVDCGYTAARAAIADRYAVTITVSTQLVPAAGGTTVQTLVKASAQDPVHNNPAVSCSSRGHLETSIADALRTAAAD
jgi:hypothetical protein